MKYLKLVVDAILTAMWIFLLVENLNSWFIVVCIYFTIFSISQLHKSLSNILEGSTEESPEGSKEDL